MKNTDTHKVVLPTGDTSGKAATAILAEAMNILVKILTKLGLLKEDLDNHVARSPPVAPAERPAIAPSCPHAVKQSAAHRREAFRPLPEKTARLQPIGGAHNEADTGPAIATGVDLLLLEQVSRRRIALAELRRTQQ